MKCIFIIFPFLIKVCQTINADFIGYSIQKPVPSQLIIYSNI